MHNIKQHLDPIGLVSPDCVPATPDFSNMIPARLTGKPCWDIYLYNDPPIREAYIAAKMPTAFSFLIGE